MVFDNFMDNSLQQVATSCVHILRTTSFTIVHPFDTAWLMHFINYAARFRGIFME